MIFESHAHYDDRAFDQDRDELLESLAGKGIEYVVNVGASLRSAADSLELAKRYAFIYAALGVHPCETAELNDENFTWLKETCLKEKRLDGQGTGKVVAVGEIGLDYYWNEPEREMQKKWFIAQLQLAAEVQLPVIIHSRDAAKDTVDILKEYYNPEWGGVIHCFSYAKETAAELLAMGFYIGIGGVITFANAKKIKEAVAEIPLERILLETDSPYLAPVPYRGKRNSSGYLPYIAEEIARIKGIGGDEAVDITGRNARRLFGIGD